MNFEEIINTLDNEGIGYDVFECPDGTKLAYIKDEYRPGPINSTFRISERDPRFNWKENSDHVYVRNCGVCEHMSMKEVIRILKRGA